MANFPRKGSLNEFMHFIDVVYGMSNDRQFSIHDLLSNQERFTMRALKGIRKGDMEKLKVNILIAFSWFMAVLNRMHIDIETEVWKRFPMLCSYCGQKPCACKKIKSKERVVITRRGTLKPRSLSDTQKMFAEIYPPERRTLEDVGVHLAEEMGEVSEAIHYYLGGHSSKQFEEVKKESADYVSCIMGIANSAKLNVAEELAAIFEDNCHVCHAAPCVCSFTFIAEYKS